MSDHVTPDQLRERLRELGGELDRSADDLDLWYFWNNVFVTVSGVVHLVLAALAAAGMFRALHKTIRSKFFSQSQSELLKHSERQRSVAKDFNDLLQKGASLQENPEMKKSWEVAQENLKTEELEKLLQTNKSLLEEMRVNTPETIEPYLTEYNKNTTRLMDLQGLASPNVVAGAFKHVVDSSAALVPQGALSTGRWVYGLPVASLVSFLLYRVVPLLYTLYELVKIERLLEKLKDLRETVTRASGKDDQQVSAERECVDRAIQQLEELRKKVKDGIPQFYDSVSNVFQDTLEEMKKAAAGGVVSFVKQSCVFIWQVTSKLLFAIVGSKAEFTDTCEAFVAAAACKKSGTGRQLRAIASTCNI